jgi:hypothetical protein
LLPLFALPSVVESVVLVLSALLVTEPAEF